jgi:hypothetical protein
MKLTSNTARPISYNISNPISYPINKVPSFLLQNGTTPPPFDPDSISGIQSRILDGGTIWTDAISSKYYLKDQSTDNTHLPRQGRAWLFDGTNDYGVIPAGVNSTWANSFSISFWTYFTGSNSYVVSVNNGASALILIVPGSINFGNTTGFNTHSATVSNIWIHWVCVYDSSLSGMSRWIIYKNSALASVGPNGSLLAPTASSGLVGIRSVGLNQPYNGSLYDLRIYSAVKNATEVTAIYNQSRTGSGTFDTTGLVAAYPCNEESGATGYDISGNGNHLTLTNITQATFHATDTGVLTNRNNDEGYRLSGSVYIPKRLSSSLAADGNALTATGRAAYHGCAETPCVAGNGSTVYVDLGSPLMPATGDYELSFWFFHTSASDERPFGQDSFIFYINAQIVRARIFGAYNIVSGTILSNDTWNKITLNRTGDLHTMTVQTPTASYSYTYTGSGSNSVSANSRLLQGLATSTAGRVSDLRITTGGVTTYFPLQDGPGSSNTNRNLAYVKSDGTGGVISNAIVNGTVSTIWGNRVPGQVKDWCIDYGGRIGAAGEYIAGLIGSANAADGSAKTLSAGKYGNPYSRLNSNPATAAEFNGRSVPTAGEVGDLINGTITPDDTGFNRVDTDGDDRFLIYEDTLTGTDLTNVENYVT